MSARVISLRAPTAAAAQPIAAAPPEPASGPEPSFMDMVLTGLTRGGQTADGHTFPDIIARIRSVIEDDEVRIERVVRMVASEPALVERLMGMARSVAVNPRGRPVKDLRTALLRAGLNLVSSTMIAFAVKQLSRNSVVKGMEDQLEQLWQRSVTIASLCYVISKRLTRINPDMALLTGLMHGVGRLYDITHKLPKGYSRANVGQFISQQWSVQLTEAIFEHWDNPNQISAAVKETEALANQSYMVATLNDVLVVASLVAVYQDRPDELQVQLQRVRSSARLGLNSELLNSLIEESQEEIDALRALLG